MFMLQSRVSLFNPSLSADNFETNGRVYDMVQYEIVLYQLVLDVARHIT